MAAPLAFPDPKSFPEDWDGTWVGGNDLIYEWVQKDEKKPGYWNVVGTVGRQGPRGEQGPMGAPGLHPTIDSDTGCWVYNWQDYEADGVTPGPEQSVTTNYPPSCAVRVIGLRGKSYINELNSEDGWEGIDDAKPRKEYLRNDGFMVEVYDDDVPSSRLFMIPWHELVDDDGNSETDEAKRAHSFIVGYVGAVGPEGKQGPKGNKGDSGKLMSRLWKVCLLAIRRVRCF